MVGNIGVMLHHKMMVQSPYDGVDEVLSLICFQAPQAIRSKLYSQKKHVDMFLL